MKFTKSRTIVGLQWWWIQNYFKCRIVAFEYQLQHSTGSVEVATFALKILKPMLNASQMFQAPDAPSSPFHYKSPGSQFKSDEFRTRWRVPWWDLCSLKNAHSGRFVAASVPSEIRVYQRSMEEELTRVLLSIEIANSPAGIGSPFRRTKLFSV